ncbi:MAG: hypothetical protein LBE71_02395 [Dysgonamonadaceae bacterium]|jgi:hypothetical protein|nr:hypothetical protein [Dysgonamonadaceae bacterium]
MIEIIKVDGTEAQLYPLVAHLVMDVDVLKYNLNYPFKTSENYCWFIARENNQTLGFIPVELVDYRAVINNYYVADDDSKVFSKLLKELVKTLQRDFGIEAITQVRHIRDFERNGFSIVLRWKRYVKMRLFV